MYASQPCKPGEAGRLAPVFDCWSGPLSSPACIACHLPCISCHLPFSAACASPACRPSSRASAWRARRQQQQAAAGAGGGEGEGAFGADYDDIMEYQVRARGGRGVGAGGWWWVGGGGGPRGGGLGGWGGRVGGGVRCSIPSRSTWVS
jgi:hypothetical protein